MERVVFLLEPGGERLGCMLNPESLVVKRSAGVTACPNAGGLVGGDALADDPLLFTGGGSTEFTFDLLFDTSIEGSSIVSNDVRALTGPLWDLAENKNAIGGLARPPICYFVWGRAWTVPGVVTAVAERLEYFDAEGVPQRAWLRMRFLRVAESLEDESYRGLSAPLIDQDMASRAELDGAEPSYVHQVHGSGGSEAPGDGDRLDQLAWRYYADPSKWRLMAWLNDIADPLAVAAGSIVNVFTQDDMETGQ